MMDPAALPDFSVIVKPKRENEAFDILNNESVVFSRIGFERLVGFKVGFYTSYPEFNYVLVSDDITGLERVFSLEDVEFELLSLSPSAA